MSLLRRLEKKHHQESGPAVRQPKPQVGAASPRPALVRKADPFVKLKSKIHEELVGAVDPALLTGTEDPAKKQELERKLAEVVEQIIEEEANHLSAAERQRITGDIIDEVMGFGPITPLLNDPTISEVMVNGPKQVYVERAGRLEITDVAFRDDDHVMHIVEKIVAPLGRRIDESMPMVDARLPDGSRVNAIIPPLSLNGPVLTIRKFAADPFTVEDLIGFGTLTPEIAEFLEACVRVRLNIVVSGGTGSGKTTLLNVLSSFIPHDERIVTIEDAAELQLQQDHVVSLESRPPNIEGKGSHQHPRLGAERLADEA